LFKSDFFCTTQSQFIRDAGKGKFVYCVVKFPEGAVYQELLKLDRSD